MNPHHHRDLCKVPRITSISEDFFLRARFDWDYEADDYLSREKIDIELRAIKDKAKEIDAVLDMYKTERDVQGYNGIVINVTKGLPIVLAIDNHMSCCEEISVDAIFPGDLTRDDFIGAAITNIKWGKEERGQEMGSCSSEIIIETSKGIMKLNVCNQHDGYYSHDVIACFNDVVERFSL
jgi:hypothetical protein